MSAPMQPILISNANHNFFGFSILLMNSEIAIFLLDFARLANYNASTCVSFSQTHEQETVWTIISLTRL
jgi:hypothetical protein